MRQPTHCAREGAGRRRRPESRPVPALIDVSVVVVNWNTREYLRRCLASVFEETKSLSIEVFVVDNASADGSADMVRAEFPQVVLIANDTNRGFAAANNQALARARGRYVLLLNPDTSVVDRAIERSVEVADADPAIGCLGCQVLLREGEIQPTGFRFPSALDIFLNASGLHAFVPELWFGGGPSMRGWDRKSARDVEVVTGMFMLVRREVLEGVGPMDESYFVYAEEADWCYRAWKAGWRCHFTPAARIIHHDGGGKSTQQIRAKMYVQLQKSLLIFLRKNRGRLSAASARLAYLMTMSARWVVLGAAGALTGNAGLRTKAACAGAAVRYHLFGVEPAR